MKCAECADRWKCGAGYDLRRKRRSCEKAKKPAKRSNADRIRAMTDEELATFLYKFGDCPCFGVKFCERGTRCEDAVLMKLREPVDNGACFNGEPSEKVQDE